MGNQHNLIAYLSTLAAIVALAVVGALIVYNANANTEVALSKLIGALAFIATAIAGLNGVIGTFRPNQQPTTQQNIAEAQNVNAGTKEGTGQ